MSHHTISAVSRLSGVPKDLLRQWERRYGFPCPSRDNHGNRLYSQQQLEKLVVIRQLLDRGSRPGKLMNLGLNELKAQLNLTKSEFSTMPLIELLQSGDVPQLQQWLQQQICNHGLRPFIHNVMAPAINAVGEAWANGVLAIYQEHLFTEAIKRQVRNQLSHHHDGNDTPRIMLTTVPGELHSLGLLMAEVLMHLSGAAIIPFGTEMPFQQIRDAAERHQVDVIALSFSAGFKTEDAVVMLNGLRQLIPETTEIWAGGSALAEKPSVSVGIKLLPALADIEYAVAEWHRAHGDKQ